MDQNWFVDDSACAARLSSGLRGCLNWDLTFSNPQKTIIVVDSKDEAEAHVHFDGPKSLWQCFLGSFIVSCSLLCECCACYTEGEENEIFGRLAMLNFSFLCCLWTV